MAGPLSQGLVQSLNELHPSNTDMNEKPSHSKTAGVDKLALGIDKMVLHWLVNSGKGIHIAAKELCIIWKFFPPYTCDLATLLYFMLERLIIPSDASQIYIVR